ncbi:MAG: YaiO family outer membrane beta-barrel protein [Proteobacteria bacterium]|nr:YaiO family outer membrane beta-barrel protein [Pseudomonadota bacterium]MBU1545810.1 YaiO family outer membrane beta-barrel protein [Pseudomonadota bacterium]MBU2619754.1 YaiO family outer membrane beta-barrel protein [Pseudomonadota bacterium]
MNRPFFALLLAGCFLTTPAHAYETVDQAMAHKDFAAAETMVRAQLQANPRSAELAFLLARLLAWQGRYDQALALYGGLVLQEPRNADYLLGQAQTLFWSGQTDGALAAAQKGLTLAPDSLELQRLHIQILLARGDEESLAQAEALLLLAEQRFTPEAMEDQRSRLQELRAPDTGFSPRREAEFGLSYEHLTHGYAEWKSVSLEGEWLYAPRRVLYGKTRLTERFSLTDEEVAIGTYQPLGSLYDCQLEISGSPSYEILPKYSLFGGLTRKLPDKWDASLGARHSEYSATYSNLYNAGLGRYFADQRLDYTLYLGKAEEASETYSHRLQWSHFYDERSRIGLYAAAGQETENTGEPGPNQLVSSSVLSLGLVGRHWLPGDRWALSYELWRQEQGDRYIRWGGALGIRLHF